MLKSGLGDGSRCNGEEVEMKQCQGEQRVEKPCNQLFGEES